MCRLLLENGGALLQQNGGFILLEQCPDATTNSGVQRLRAAEHYREVQRRQALQDLGVRLAELRQQEEVLRAELIAHETLREDGETQRRKAKKRGTLVANLALDDRIAVLVRELAAVTGALTETKAAVAKLDAAEDDDETMIMLLLGQSHFVAPRVYLPITDDEAILMLANLT